MLAKTPKEAVTFADEAFNKRDLEGVLAFYEDEAIMLYEPGRVATGKAEIRRVFEALLNLNVVAKQEKVTILEAGDLALWTSKWSVSGQALDGSAFARGGFSSVILRKQFDGGWRVAVENPWGSAVLNTAESNGPLTVS